MEEQGEKKYETLQKVKDMMLYAYPALAQFPKSERFAMVARIKDIMDDMLEMCIEIENKIYRKNTLQNLDVANKKLQTYLQVAHFLQFLSTHKYEVWSAKSVEIGKMIGGALKAAKQPANHRE